MGNRDNSAHLARTDERALVDNALLSFVPEADALRTQFRDSALNYIYRTALGLSGERLKSASVSVWSTPDEEDSLTLDLTLTVDADWDFIAKLSHDILVRVSEWSREWTEEGREDYGRRIYFAILPLNLIDRLSSTDFVVS